MGVWGVGMAVMTRTAPLLLVVVLVVGAVSAVPMAAAASSTSSVATAIDGPAYAQVDENATENASVSPGERLSAVVGVSQAEFEGELELRAYGIAFARATTADAKAEVVRERLDDIEARLEELETRRASLEEARDNGSMSEGEYRARVTALAARGESVQQLANASAARAGELPADVLAANGVNASAIETLRQDAANMTGPEVAAIARSIAGPDVGQAVSQGPPERMGATDGVPSDRDGDGEAPDDASAAIDRAEEQLNATQSRLEEVERRVDEAGGDENATEAIAAAREELELARDALDDARTAADEGDAGDATALAEAALSHAQAAESHLQDALEALQQADDGSGASGSGGTSGSGYP